MEKTTDKGEQMTPPKGYKHTELGVLPENWEVVRLGDVCEIRNGFAFQSKKFKKSGFPIVRISNIKSNNSISLKDMVYFSSDDYKNKDLKNFIVHQDDVLVALSGATTGKIGKMEEDVILYLNQRVGKFQPSERLNNDFLYQCLLLQSNILFLLSGGGAQPNLSTTTIKNKIFIPLPPLAEQEKIAEILGTWDTQIQNFESLIAEKQALKKGLCQTLLTAKTRLKGFSGDWEVVRLGDVAEITMGASPKSEFYNQDSIGFPLIQGKNDTLGKQSLAITYTQKSLKECEEEDILMSVRAPIGFVFWASEKSSIGRGVCAIRAKQNQTFLFYILDFLEKKWERIGQGSTFTAISKNDILDFQFAIPPLTEQEKIAEILSEVDNGITLLEQKLESLKSQKRGLMQNLLNGKVRVK